MGRKSNTNTSNKIKQILAIIALIIVVIALQFGISRYILNKINETEVYFYEYRIAETEIAISPEKYTGEEVTVEITTQKTGLSIQYKLKDSDEWIDYTGPFSVDENTVVSARLVSEKDNFTGPITEKEIKNIAVAKIGDEYYQTLADAIKACPENAGVTQTKIEMLTNITESVVIPEGKNIVLDLCGATVTGTTTISKGDSEIGSGENTGENTGDNTGESTGDSAGDISEETAEAVIKVYGKLNLIDSTKNEDGSLQGNGKIVSTITPAIKVAQTGSFTLGTNESGTDVSVSIENPVVIGETYGVVVEESGEFNFYDGEISGKTNAINGTVTDTPKGYKVATNVNGEYEVATLKTTYTITYDLNYLENDLYGEKIIQTDTYKDLATTISKKTTDYETAKYGKSIEFTMDNDVTSTYIGVYFDNSIVEYGKTYTWSVHLKASSEMSLKLGAEQQGFCGPLTITTDWEKYTYTFTATDTGYTAFVMYILQQANAGDKLYMHSLELMEGQPTHTTDIKIEDSTLGELSTPVRLGYIFKGWYTKPDDGEKINSSTVVSKDATYYAHWVPIKYEISYNSNTGTGIMENTTAIYDVSVTLPDSKFTKTGYTLKGWNTKPDGTGNAYLVGNKVKNLTNENLETVTLYAIWEDTIAPNKETPTGTGATNSITVNCNQTDDGTGIDNSTIEYSIFNIDANSDGIIDSWSDWQTSSTFTNLKTNTEYQLKTRVKDNAGNGPTESEVGKISTNAIENGTLVIHKDNEQGDVVTPETSSDNKNNPINNNIYLAITQSTTGTTTVTVKTPEGTSTDYSQNTVVTTQTGMYEITLKTTDGTNEVKDIYYVYVDKTLPTINTTSTATTNSITVNANAQDEHSTVTSVTYTIKNGEQVIETNTTGVFTGLEDNTNYTIEITVTDKPGNIATSTEIIKTEKLEVGTLTFEESTTLTAFAPATTEPTDAANIVWINENVNTKLTQGSAGTTTYEITAPDGTKTAYSADSQITTQEGAYIATVSTTDGTNTETINYYFSVDKTNPTVTINPNTQEYTIAVGNNMATIGTTLTATDNTNGSGVFTTKYAWSTSNTDEPQSWSDFTSGVEVTTSKNGGIYYVWTNVADKAGNIATTVKTSDEFDVGYAVEYDVNGGTGNFVNQRKEHGIDLALSNTMPTRDGFIFKGWASTQDATTPEYTVSAGSSSLYTKDASIRLYAVWSEIVATTTIDGVITNYDSVQGAIVAAGTNEGATVTLIKTNIEENVTVAAGQDIVLDINGKNLTSTTNTVTNNGTLEIIDSNTINPGTLGSTATRIDEGENAYYIIDNYGKLNLASGTLSSTNTGGIYNKSTGIVEVTGGTIHTYGQAIRNGGLSTSETEPSVKITGGDFRSTLNTLVNGSVGLMHITGGTISSENLSSRPTILMGESGIIKIDDGTITAEADRAITMWNSESKVINGKIQINGGTISGVQGVTSSAGGVIEITGGTITATTHAINCSIGDVIVTGGKISGDSLGIYKTQGTLTIGNNSNAVSTQTPEITGKEKGIQVADEVTFNFYDGIIKGTSGNSIVGEVDDIPTDYEVTKTTTDEVETAILTIQAVASTTIGNSTTYYASVQKAIDAAGTNAGATVTLLKETITESVTIAEGQDLTLNLNGNTLTYKNGVTLTNNGKVTIDGDGALTGNGASGVYPITNKGILIKNGSGTLASTTAASSSTVQYIINNTVTGTVVINDGTLTSNDRGIFNAGSTNNASFTMNGGTLTTTDYAIYNASALSTEENPSVKISNAQVTSNSGDAIFNTGTGMVVVENSTITASTYGIHSDNTGTVTIKDSTITSTTSWGICNSSSGTVNVYNSNITGYVHGLGNASAATGKINIYSGNIIGETNDGVATGKGTITIGTDDGIISVTNPKIQGKRYGVNINSTSGKVYFYDGIIISTSSTSIYGGSVAGKPANSVVQTTSNSTGGQDSILIGAYVEYNDSAEIVKGYDTLALATENATSGNTIKAMASLTETTEATVPEGKNLTLDLNAKTITLSEIALKNRGTLTITDTTSEATGKITKTTSTTNPANTAISNFGDIIVEKGTIHCTAPSIYNESTGTLTVNGGTISSGFIPVYDMGTSSSEDKPSVKVTGGTISNAIGAPGINSVGGGLVYITGGTIKNTSSLAISAQNVKITGGEVSGGSNGPAVAILKTGEISGGTITSAYQGVNLTSSATATITGGTVTCTSQTYGAIVLNENSTLTLGIDDGEVSTEIPSITGNKYGLQIEENTIVNFYDGIIAGPTGNSIYGTVTKVADNYTIVKGSKTVDSKVYETSYLEPKPEEVTYGEYTSAGDYVAGYDTLAEATSGATSGNTIKALKSVTETTAATIDATKTLTFDLNGRTITIDTVKLTNNGTLTITDLNESGTGELILKGTVGNPTTAPISNYGKLILNNTKVTSNSTAIYNQSTGRILMSETTLDGGYLPIYNAGTSIDESEPSFKMTSGTINCSTSTPAINSTSTGLVYITGGTIDSAGIAITGGSIKITGGTLSARGSNMPTLSSSKNVEITDGTINATYMGLSLSSGANATIKGGTFNCTSTSYAGVVVNKGATLTLGTDDSSVSTTSPSIKGGKYGIEVVSEGTFNFYDGIVKGISGGAISGTVTDVPTDYEVEDGTETIDGTTYETAYLSVVIPTYTVTYDYATNGGVSNTDSSIQTEDLEVEYNTAIDLTKQGAKTNYTFVGWNTDANATTAIDSLTMANEDVTLYAIYSKQVTVKYDKNGGAEDVSNTYTMYNKNTSLEITTPNPTTFTGWTFNGYGDTNTATSGDLAGVTKTITVAENTKEVTYYHTWAKTVTYDGNKPSIADSSYNVTLNEQTREVYYNNKFGTLPTNPTLQGFTFNGWYTLEQNGEQITENTLAKDVPNTIYASWTLAATMIATPEQVTLDLSDNKTQAISITGSNYGTVSYKSAHTNIATVDANGLITAVANGSTTITVTCSNGNLTDTVLVTVVTTPTSIEISQDSAVIGILDNNTVALNATITPNTANTKNGVTWSSNNSDIAKVDSKTGVVTGVAKGTAIITATTENGCTDTCQITVDGTAPIVSVTMDSAEYEQAHTATVTITDDLGGLPASQSISYAWSKTKDTVPTDWQTKTITTTEGNLTATTQIDAPYDSTGVYYIWIKSGVQDKFGNSTTGHYLNIQVTANLDNTIPVIELSGTSSPLKASANSNIVIPIKITDEHSGMDTTGAIADCLTADDIVVKVNGTTVTPTTKELTYNTSASGVYSYTLNLAGVQGSGKLTVHIDAGKVKDMAGNSNAVTTLETGVTMDSSSFSATITTEANNPNNLSEITYKITFNKPVTGFTVEDIEVTNGTKGTFAQTDEAAKEFTIVVTNSGSCYQTIDVTTGSCTDASGNTLADVTKLTIQIDRTAPEAPEVTARADSETGVVKGTVAAGEAATVYTGVANTYLTFAGTDNETQVVGYKVATSADADFASLETVNSFNLTAPTWGLTYFVKSVDEVGNISEDATEVTVRLVTLSITPETMSIENEKTGTLTAERANVGTITWTSSDNTIATVSAAGVVTAKKVGQVTITATSSNDTTVKDTSVITVTKGNVEVPIAVTGLVYNGTAQTGVVDNSDKYTITGNTQTDAGSYQAIAKLSDPTNYQWADGTTTDKTINWQIAQKQLTVTVSADDKVYDGTRNVKNGRVTLTGIVTGDSVLAGATFQYETATVGTDKLINVTEFALGGVDADNYVLDITETTTTADITKATLTATYVSETIKYGETPALKVNVTGFVNGETAGTAEKYVLPTVTNANTAIGEYTLTPAGGSATNYTFKYVSGKLTIEAINYTITYELNGGALASGKTNPSTYTMITDTFTLNNPTKSGYEFLGWTGTGVTGNTKTVTVAKGSTGNRTYTANWQLVAPTVSVTAQNLNVNLFDDVTTTFTANVENGANPTYQWYYNDTPIDGATQSTYSLPTSEMTESNYKGGAYKVAVTNNEEAQAVMLLADGNNTTTVSDTFTQTVAITVGNANQLKNLATRVNDQDIKFTGNTIKQTANIDLSSVCGSSKGSFTPIGYYDPTNGALSKAIHGTYDGQNFEVTNLYIDETTTFNRVALFGLIWDGTVKNLTVRGTVTTSDTATVTAGIVGQGTAATIENCKNYVNVSGPTYVAGILGFGHGTYIANIINCENYGTITVGVNYGGGIAGLGNAIIDNCRNYGSVNGTNVGGIASYNNESSDIRNCTNNGTVTGINVGGICFKGFANITHCTNNGEIIAKNTGSDGSLYAAGIAYMNLGIIEETKNTGKVTAIGESNNAGIVVAGILARDSSAAIGTIRKSFNTGEIIAKCVYTGTSDAMAVAGGIVGYANDNLIIEDCYNTGNVTSTKKQGGNTNSASGIIGYCISANLEIKNCYSSGLITTQREDGNSSFNGGILAQKVVEEGQTVTITNCYYEQGKAAGGIQGTNVTGSAEPKTAAYMITDDFVTLLGASNWEIVATFNKHYPVLDWEYETSTITYDLAGGQLPTGTTNPSKYAKESANYTLTNPIRNGYTFKGWTGSNGTTAQTSVTIASGSTGDKTFTANWEANTYYIAYYDGDTLLGTSEHIYDSGSALTTMSALGGSKSGFTFEGWTTSETGVTKTHSDGQTVYRVTIIPNNTIKLYAIWKRNVTFTSGPKSTSTSASAVQYYNSKGGNYSVTTPKPADISNWTALGWRADTTAGDKTIASESVSTSSASVFYGAYSRQVNCYSGENKETVVQATEYYNTGSAAHSTKLPTPATLTGWTIRGWRIDTTADDKEFAAGGTSTTASAVYYAVYARDITFYHGTAKAKTTTVQQYYNSATSDKGLITMPTAEAITSWKTLGWRYDTTAGAAIYTESQSIAPVSELVYYAVYSRTITLSYNANGGTGTIANSAKTQYYNTNGAITAMSFTLPSSGFTKSGGKLSKWAAGSASGTQYSLGATYTAFSPAVGTTTVTQTMYAIWANGTYTVNYYNGATKLGSSSHTYGTAKALTTIANLGGSLSGYTFYGWTASTTATARTYTDGQSVNNLTTTDGGTVNLYAIWSRTATFISGNNKATTATATQYYNNKGAKYSVTTPSTGGTKSGWTLAGWRDDTTAEAQETAAGSASTSSSATFYAVYYKNITFYSGIAKATNTVVKQYYNSYNNTGTITVPAVTAINNGFTVLGYRNDTGTNVAENVVGEKIGSPSTTYYAVYSRTITLKYNANGGTGTVANQTKTQYYNSNGGISSVSFTLSNCAFTNGDLNFSKWAAGSATGTQYAAGVTYAFSPAVSSSTITQTMYAIWSTQTIIRFANGPSAGGGGGDQSGGGGGSATIEKLGIGYTVYYTLSASCTTGGSGTASITYDSDVIDSISVNNGNSKVKEGSFTTTTSAILSFSGSGSGGLGQSGTGGCTITKILDANGNECLLKNANE